MRRRYYYGILLFLILDLILFAFWYSYREESEILPLPGELPEIQELQGKQLSFKELSRYFTDLAKKKGAAYAFSVLSVTPLPPDIDIHLLGHLVGDELYRQQGIQGIHLCTNDFRNACSHSVVIGLLMEKGEQGLPEIAETCRKAPGGSGAYTMCFHGLGHGVLAFKGYDLEAAIDLCKKTGTPAYQNREYVECVGGTIMEIIGGVHDRQAWERQVAKYFKKDDALYPCSSDFMPEKARSICYTYITPHLFEAVGADLGAPTPREYEQAFKFCKSIPEAKEEHRDACYGGFGKEFVVLAQSRDVRLASLQSASTENLEKMYRWCLLAGDEKGERSCLDAALNSLYWGGENDVSQSFGLCSVMEGTHKDHCLETLFNAVRYYSSDQAYKREVCNKAPDAYKASCQKELGIQAT